MESLEYLQKYSRIRKKGFSSYVKNIIIETYEVQCNIVNCVSRRN